MGVREKIDANFLYFFDQGQSYKSYEVFGAHLVKDEKGNNVACEFCLYAPNAKRVQLVGEWNNFEENRHELYCIDEKGVWYAYLEGNYEWQRYKYLIDTHDGQRIYKADPYAFYSQVYHLLQQFLHFFLKFSEIIIIGEKIIMKDLNSIEPWIKRNKMLLKKI